MNPGEKAHQGLMTPNSCVEISPRKFNIFPIDLILKVIVILICFSPRLQCSLHTPRLQCQFTFLVAISKHFSPSVCCSLWESGLITGQKRPPLGSLFAQINQYSRGGIIRGRYDLSYPLLSRLTRSKIRSLPLCRIMANHFDVLADAIMAKWRTIIAGNFIKELYAKPM